MVRALRPEGLAVCLPSNVLHLMPRPDFLRPLVAEPVCKSLFGPSPDLPCPDTTEHTYSVPFSQEPEGGSPCKQGVTLPFFPHPPPVVATLHLLPRNPPRSWGSPFSPHQERIPLGTTTHPYSLLLYWAPTHQHPLSVVPLTEVIVGTTGVELVSTFPLTLAVLRHADPVGRQRSTLMLPYPTLHVRVPTEMVHSKEAGSGGELRVNPSPQTPF